MTLYQMGLSRVDRALFYNCPPYLPYERPIPYYSIYLLLLNYLVVFECLWNRGRFCLVLIVIIGFWYPGFLAIYVLLYTLIFIRISCQDTLQSQASTTPYFLIESYVRRMSNVITHVTKTWAISSTSNIQRLSVGSRHNTIELKNTQN